MWLLTVVVMVVGMVVVGHRAFVFLAVGQRAAHVMMASVLVLGGVDATVPRKGQGHRCWGNQENGRAKERGC